jgi:hypothetical protein
MHDPPTHSVAEPQTLPHVPQLLELFVVLTHAPLHAEGVGATQFSVHEVPLHAAEPLPAVGIGHAVPHCPPLPQPFDGPGVSHVPPQSSMPAGQAHVPPWQVLPPVHIVMQLPQ